MTVSPQLLPYGRPVIDEDDIAAVSRVLRSQYLTTGPTVARFETAFADAVSAPFAVVCSSGTAALHLSMIAADLGPGDAVVVPTLTFLATANAARFVGAEVVFADVDPDTALLTPGTLEHALDRGADAVKAIAPVHMNGQTVDMVATSDIAGQRGLKVIEDACHALGAGTGAGNAIQPVGNGVQSDMAVFSTHAVKTITMGEGGVITTRNEMYHAKLLRLRNHGMERHPDSWRMTELAFDSGGEPNPWYYEMAEPGFNYRASDLHCALGLSQLSKLERFVSRRRALARRYERLLGELAPIVKPVPQVAWSRSAFHLYVVLIDFPAAGISRGALMRALYERGIGTQVHYLPVHRQPYYRGRYGELHLPGADRYYERALSLPLFPAMADADVDRVVDELRKLIPACRAGN